MKHDSLINILKERFAAAVAQVAGTKPGEIDPVIRPGDPKFGDYQCNVAMSLAKTLKAKPRDIAQRIVDAIDLTGIAEPLEIAGPGFINIRLTNEFLSRYLGEIPPRPTEQGTEARRHEGTKDRLGMPPIEKPQKVVIDYSSPNIAKQMHVGHLRSTIIGDAFARVLMFEGHEVVRQNHVGDWGTQFGQIILSMWHLCMARHRADPDYVQRMGSMVKKAKEKGREAVVDLLRKANAQHQHDLDSDPDGTKVFLPFLEETEAHHSVSLDDLECAYQFVTAVEELAEGTGLTICNRHRNTEDPYDGVSNIVTVMLQVEDPRNEQERRAWEYAREITLEYIDAMYSRLGALLTRDDVRGESFYRDRLAGVVAELRRNLSERGRGEQPTAPWAELRDDQGAVCVFFYDAKGEPRFKRPDGEPLPMIVQKSDGAYNYETTDLAGLRYRIDEVGASRLIYVTDARQKQHFAMFFAAARAAGWVPDDVSLEHVAFGSILGADRKPLKTREGENVKLRELLDEAEKRARELLESREEERHEGTKARRHEAEEGGAAEFSEPERREIAQRVGVAAVKYADLRNDRVSDYVFSWDKMLAMQGNTAPYVMYAYARIRSIYRKAAERFAAPDVYAAEVQLALEEPAERTLALRLARLRETIDAIAADLSPHILCSYSYELASEFMRFYEACPVLRAPDQATRLSRMRLCDLTARALKLGLGLLGIETIERM